MKTLALTFAAYVAFCATSRAAAETFGSGANTFEIEFVTIHTPGNPPDTTGDPNPAGSVDYVYNIGKYEVSRDMVEKATAEGGLGLLFIIPGGPRPDMPATNLSWNEAARFANWLNTSQGFPVAYKFGTQPGEAGYDANENIGLWRDGQPGFDAANPFRNSQAQYFLPSVNEWYKAAYYDPSANGGTGGYWNYPTGSDAPPRPVASGTDPNTAVFLQPVEQGPADITQAGGLSPYGVMGLGGNVWEWEETAFGLKGDGSSVRGVRGGDFFAVDSSDLSASVRQADIPTDRIYAEGFRVASIPEPSSLLLGVLGALGLLLRRRTSR